MAENLLIALPESAAGAPHEAHWWHIAEGRMLAEGSDDAWIAIASAGQRSGLKVTGLAPASAVRLIFDRGDRSGATPGQAAAVARIEALDSCLGDRETLHAVTGRLGLDSAIVTAIVANGTMLEWLDWARAAGVELDHVIPAASILPFREEWASATIGSDHMLVRHDAVLPNEPAIVEAILGSEPPQALDEQEIRASLAAAAGATMLDLRSGRFAKRRRLAIDRGRIRELVLLAALIPLITLIWAIVSIVKLDHRTEQLDRESLQVAEAALGRPVVLENAEAELAQNSGSGLTAPLAAFYQALQSEAAVTSTQIGYGAGGILSATLAAPSVDDINRLLLGLQRDGYRVTAVPRQSPDGRAMVDLTVRVGP